LIFLVFFGPIAVANRCQAVNDLCMGHVTPYFDKFVTIRWFVVARFERLPAKSRMAPTHGANKAMATAV
jgi:hypothetical protein